MNRSTRRALLTALITAASMHVIVGAQGQVGQNINIVSGSADQFIGDMFRQRQNEPVLGISSVNPSHMMAAYNDYRTVDFVDGFVPPSPIQSTIAKVLKFFLKPFRREREGARGEAEESEIAAAQAWVGLSFSDNAGKDWYTGLLPGHASLPPAQGTEAWDQSTQLTQFDAASDPVMATTPDQFFVGGIVFTPGGSSAGIVSRFTDKNDTATGQNIHFDGLRVLLTVPAGLFVDKPSIAAGPNGHVYVAFVVFDQSDPQKLSSKIVFFRSTDYGVTWSASPGNTISQPLSRNQSPWIVVDPNNENIVYIGWRVFSIKTGGWANAIVGRKSTDGGASFTPSVPYPVALALKAFDAPQVPLSPTTLQIPRSNAYPTAAIDGNGAIHVAIQEYVYPADYSTASLRGLPLLPGVLTTTGVPRITVTTSYNGGATWTIRKAVDPGTTANPAGTQFMPVLTAVGEPGPSCSGQSGPSSRIMLMYYDARAGGIGKVAGTNGAIAGGDRQFDVRIAHASACTRDALGRPIFGPSEQLSRYTRSATSPHGIVTTAGEINGVGVTAVNRAYSMFCGGNCAFSGDYIHLTPRVPYVQTAAGWKLTTASAVNKNNLPAPMVQGVWADMRDGLLPTVGALRPVPAGASPIDALPWNFYSPPGTGNPSCLNPGSRDQNIYTAEYAPGQLYAAAPEGFRASDFARAYPIYVESRAGQQRYFRLTINAAANASFDIASYATPNPVALDKTADIVVGPYSSVTGSVVIGPGQNETVLVTVEQLATTTDTLGNVIQSGSVLVNGAKTTLALHAAGDTALADTQTHEPVVAPTPVLSYPFEGRLPITIPAGSTFSESPFSQTTFEQNPFSQTPFSQTPFTEDVTIHKVTDISFEVTLDGTDAAAFAAQLAVQNVLALKGSYLFQVLINRIVSTNALDGCEAIERPKDMQVSSIVTPFSQTPFSQTPFSQTPFSQTPFSQTPFSQTPFSQTPFSQTPFSQTSDPRDPAVSNSTFYIAPPGTSSPSYRAARRVDKVNYVLRVFQMKATGDPLLAPFIPPNDEAPVGLTIISDTPEVIALPGGGFGFDPVGGSTGSGGAAVPVKLGFVVQPTSTALGMRVTPAVQVAIQDGFGNTVTGSTAQVTIAIGTNPANGTLSGTLTRTAVAGIATFDDLSIGQPGTGYTLIATSGNFPATSAAFDISFGARFGVLDTDFISAGFGGMRGNGTGTITLNGVTPGTVTRALLFWHGPTNSSDPNVNATVAFGGATVTGTNIGFAYDNSWGFANSQAYRADVTSLVAGDGSYSLSDFRKAGEAGVAADINGASLIVFFQDASAANNRDVYLLNTNDSNIVSAFDAASWNGVVSGINYVSGSAQLELHVADGQSVFPDATLLLNGNVIAGPGAVFQGDSVPKGANAQGLWDIQTYNIASGVLVSGTNTLTLATGVNQDYLSLVVMLVSAPRVPPGPSVPPLQ